MAHEDFNKPQNGIAGLAHWRYDLMAGFVVSLISVSFNLAIAITSGAPPIAGMISGIVAGLLVPFVGGSYVTICSCAAGLAPALYAGMKSLGHGNTMTGYTIIGACIMVVGLIQIVLAKLKLARRFMVFPNSMVHGMLAAIGLGILVKQIPVLMGMSDQFKGMGFFQILINAPRHMNHIDHKLSLVSFASLFTVFGIAAFSSDDEKAPQWRKWAPIVATLVTTVLSVVLSSYVGLDSKYLIQLPNGLLSGISTPNFTALFSDSTLWWNAISIILLLTIIDGGESLATIAAIDKKDPFNRRSEANGTLMAMGSANIVSGFLGGLTIIPGGLKSSANIVAGGRTQWSNFYNACFLLIYTVFLSKYINMIPVAGLAAIVCLMGWKLCKPKIWLHTYHVGSEQLLIFVTTVAATLVHDLLWGIIGGIVMKLFVVLYKVRQTDEGKKLPLWGIIKLSFRSPVKEVDAGVSYKIDGDYEVVLNGPVTCFNSYHLQMALEKIPRDVKLVVVRYERTKAHIIDHTSAEALWSFKSYFEKTKTTDGKDRVCRLEIEDGMSKSSQHTLSLRVPTLRAGLQSAA